MCIIKKFLMAVLPWRKAMSEGKKTKHFIDKVQKYSLSKLFVRKSLVFKFNNILCVISTCVFL